MDQIGVGSDVDEELASGGRVDCWCSLLTAVG